MAGVVYAQVGPHGGLLAGGSYQIPTANLNKVRDRIIEDAEQFSKLTDTLAQGDIRWDLKIR